MLKRRTFKTQSIARHECVHLSSDPGETAQCHDWPWEEEGLGPIFCLLKNRVFWENIRKLLTWSPSIILLFSVWFKGFLFCKRAFSTPCRCGSLILGLKLYHQSLSKSLRWMPRIALLRIGALRSSTTRWTNTMSGMARWIQTVLLPCYPSMLCCSHCCGFAG